MQAIKISLDLMRKSFIQRSVKQYDDVPLEIYLFENGVPLNLTGADVDINVVKDDNSFIIQSRNITINNNCIITILERDSTRVSGKTKVEVKTVLENKQKSTFEFYLDVIGSILEGAIESANVITIVEDLQTNIVDAKQAVKDTDNLIKAGGAVSKKEIGEFHKVARTTDGYGDRGGVFGIIANNPNPDFQLGVCGYRDAKHTSEYLNRDSVAQFTQIDGANATITYNNTDIVYTVNTAKFPSMSDSMFDKIKVGMVVDTLHRPNQWTGIIKSLDKANKTIIMDVGFYQVGNNAATSMPTVGTGLQINKISKIYGYNSIIHLPFNCETEEAVAFEIDLFKDKQEGNIGGIDMVNMGKKAMYGFYTHKAFNGEGFIYGHITTDCEVGWGHRWIDAQKHLPAFRTENNGDFLVKGFSIYNDGTLSKIKSFVTVITNSTQVPGDGNTTYLFNINDKDCNYSFVKANVAGEGTLRFVKNIGSKTVILVDNGFVRNSVKNSYTLKKGDSAILLSDGVSWNIISEYNNNPKGYDIVTQSMTYPFVEDIDTIIANGTNDLNIDIYLLKDLKTGSKIYVKNIGTKPCMLWNSGFYTDNSSPKENVVIGAGQSKTLIYNGNNAWFVI